MNVYTCDVCEMDTSRVYQDTWTNLSFCLPCLWTHRKELVGDVIIDPTEDPDNLQELVNSINDRVALRRRQRLYRWVGTDRTTNLKKVWIISWEPPPETCCGQRLSWSHPPVYSGQYGDPVPQVTQCKNCGLLHSVRVQSTRKTKDEENG